jgi:hypothetical protein
MEKTYVLGENLSRDNVAGAKTTCKALCLHPDLRGEKPTNSHLSYAVASFVPTQHTKDTTSYVTRDGICVCTGSCLDRCNRARPPLDGLSYKAKLTDHLLRE